MEKGIQVSGGKDGPRHFAAAPAAPVGCAPESFRGAAGRVLLAAGERPDVHPASRSCPEPHLRPGPCQK